MVLTRFYHNVAERELPEPLSDEDLVRTSLRCSPRRQSAEYRQWSPRNESERYEDLSPSTQGRRARTKPDVDRLVESEMNKARRCNRCGNLSNKKSEQPRKNVCRFDNGIKGPIGKIVYLIANSIFQSFLYFTYRLFVSRSKEVMYPSKFA